MLPLSYLVHGFLGILGLLANSVLILAIIISRRNIYLQTYSLLLFNSALNDLLASVADGMTMMRMVVDGPSLVHIYSGPCIQISEKICFFTFANSRYSMMLHLVLHSIALIAISFWYRWTALSPGACPTAKRIQLICLVAFAPTLLLQQVHFHWALSSKQEVVAILNRIYPQLDTSNLSFTGTVDLMAPHLSASTLYICILPIIAYTVIIIMRRQAKRKIAGSQTMSDRTKSMHEALVRALTIHAFLPIFPVAGLGSFELLYFGVPRSEQLESCATMAETFASVANPLLTLYFVTPLRRSIYVLLKMKKKQSNANMSVGSTNTKKAPNVI